MKYRVWWKYVRHSEFKCFYKEVIDIDQAVMVLEVLSNFCMFLGYIDCEGGVDEWDENLLDWRTLQMYTFEEDL